MRTQQVDGKNLLQLKAAKASQTMALAGTRKGASEKRLARMCFDDDFRDKVRAGMMKIGKDGLSAAERGAKAARNTMIKNGTFIDPEKASEWYRYSRRVRYLTSKQPLHLLENIEKRGAIDIGGWHLDHIVSVKAGFDQGISEEEIAHISNLRMIPAIDNVKKGSR